MQTPTLLAEQFKALWAASPANPLEPTEIEQISEAIDALEIVKDNIAGGLECPPIDDAIEFLVELLPEEGS